MKLYQKYLFGFPLVCLFLLCFAVSARAESVPVTQDASVAYRVSKEADGYHLSADVEGAPLLGLYAGIREVIAAIPTSDAPVRLYMAELTVDEPLTLTGSLQITGDATFTQPLTLQDGARITFLDGEYRLSYAIRLRDASMTVAGGSLLGADGGVVLMDYSSRASLEVKGGTLSCDGSVAAVTVHMGSLIVTGGEIVNGRGAAVRTTVGMTLSGTPTLRGAGCDVSASRPIELSYLGVPFASSLTLRTDSHYTEGSACVTAYGATVEAARAITVLDARGAVVPTRYFAESNFCEQTDVLAVYMPFEVRYMASGVHFATAYYLFGETVALPTPPEKKGYRFIQYYKENDDAPVSTLTATSDLTLVADYRLMPATFSISSLTFTYDGTPHAWAPTLVEHPLLEEGSLSWAWYREGALLASSSSTLYPTTVADSGVYRLSLTFTHQGESVTVESADLTLTVEKRPIVPPTIAPALYNGRVQIASVLPSPDYTVMHNAGGVHRGAYPVVLLLQDCDNTCWTTTEQSEIGLYFEILQSENAWVSLPTLTDIYEGGRLSYSAMALYGEVRFWFSPRGTNAYSPDPPSAIGEYCMIARVDETPDYRAIESEPIFFSILKNEIVSIRIINVANCLQYTAFSTFDPTGMRISATYLDGTVSEIPQDQFEILYPSGNAYFLASDTYVTVCVAQAQAVQSVRVLRASYDVSHILFSDLTTTFSGAFETIVPSGDFPVGLDGVPLGYRVDGGGVSSGVYTVTLTFLSDSTQYTLPDPITRTLTVTPISVLLSWGASSFIYNGTSQVPVASYVDLLGARHTLRVEGGAVRAGDSYLATAVMDSADYLAENPTLCFSITRASYDLSSTVWQGGSYIYDGTVKSVVLAGLPEGVSVASYTDAQATHAGIYYAAVTLSYDSENYNQPTIAPYEWQIGRAAYSTDEFTFLGGTLVYNGEVQYPTLSGGLPIGADGSSPTFSFDRGVRDVSEGCVEITISFSTSSRNYLPPAPMTLTLSISPMPIEVTWGELSFVYDGTPHLPAAASPLSLLSVSGSGVSAGEYIAVCRAIDPNYTVKNDRIAFCVTRAENRWISPLTVTDVYTSGRVAPTATPLVGAVVYRYFLDAAATQEIDEPTESGVYFVRGEVCESENYLALYSSVSAFRVLEVLPVRLQVDVAASELYAFMRLCDADLRVTVVCNDGSSYPCSDYTVHYTTADSLRAGDRSIRVSADGLSQSVPITVKRAAVDLSGLVLEQSCFVYSAEPVTPVIVGLPDGFVAIGISGGGAIAAGEYALTFTLAYDRDNYEEVGTLTLPYTVTRRLIPLPILEDLVYNGTEQSPTLPTSADYIPVGIQRGTRAGSYSVFFTLCDPRNTAFEGALDETCEVQYRITPLPITVQMSNVIRYRDRMEGEIAYTVIEGAVLPTDTLSYTPILDGAVGAVFENPNYEVRVLVGTLTETNRLSPEGRERRLLCIVWVIPVLLLIVVLLLFGRPLLDYLYHRMRICALEGGDARPLPNTLVSSDLPPDGGGEERAVYESHTGADDDCSSPRAEWSAPVAISLTDTAIIPVDESLADTDKYDEFPTEYQNNAENNISDGTDSCIFGENEDDIPTNEEIERADDVAEDSAEQISFFGEKIYADSAEQEQIAPRSLQMQDLAPLPISDCGNTENETDIPTEHGCFDEKMRDFDEKMDDCFVSSPLYQNKVRTDTEQAETAEDGTLGAYAMSVDRADDLIADVGARELMAHEEAIETYGRRRSVINVDTLSASFESGDRVDVNILKERYLIPYDTGYLKVLARGCIDKPLCVYANDFSLCAVKMLLLSGGRAVKTPTIPAKKRKDPLAK